MPDRPQFLPAEGRIGLLEGPATRLHLEHATQAGRRSGVRVVLLGDFQGRSDEGMRKLSRALAQRLGQHNHVLEINTRDALRWETIRRVRDFKPDVIHYLTGPTVRTLLLLALYRRLAGDRVITISSAIRPYFSAWERKCFRALRPSLVLTQSDRWERAFRRSGIPTRFVGNGVDTTAFRPFSLEDKRRLREKYGLPAEGEIVLHVGHLRANRRLETLLAMQEAGIQTVVVGSPALSDDNALRDRLVAAGSVVICDFLEHVEEIYGCGDCYFFPVLDRPTEEFPSSYNEIGVIDTPLSVLEAMSCNLPIVTTRFGALPRMFPSVPGVRFFDGSAEDALREVRSAFGSTSETRRAVLPFDLSRVREAIQNAYHDTLHPVAGITDR
jgi:glycosyltransferase involved in cell wall biosynthesis